MILVPPCIGLKPCDPEDYTCSALFNYPFGSLGQDNSKALFTKQCCAIAPWDQEERHIRVNLCLAPFKCRCFRRCSQNCLAGQYCKLNLHNVLHGLFWRQGGAAEALSLLQVGGVLGKGGATITQVRKDSGAGVRLVPLESEDDRSATFPF